MMTLSFIRILFLMASGVVGYYVGGILNEAILGVEIGMLTGLVVIFLEKQLKKVSMVGLSSMVFGLILGVFMAKMLIGVINLLPLTEFVSSISEVIITLIFSYLGAVIALRGKDEFNIIIPYVRFKRQNINDTTVLLDSSAIIDGRIIDVYLTKFLSGNLLAPRSVLQEIQMLADSENDMKRERGRRGLEVLKKMKADKYIELKIHEDDLNDLVSVDDRLIGLAKVMDASICTTDFNLSRIAIVQGIEILNINDLAKAIKTVVATGEVLEVKLVKEGKEADQAVGYLEDGTMIVVRDGRDAIRKSVSITVTSVLQTQAGKMIFADRVPEGGGYES